MCKYSLHLNAVERFVQSLHGGLGDTSLDCRLLPSLSPDPAAFGFPKNHAFNFLGFFAQRSTAGRPFPLDAGHLPSPPAAAEAIEEAPAYPARNLVCRPRSRGASHLFPSGSRAAPSVGVAEVKEEAPLCPTSLGRAEVSPPAPANCSAAGPAAQVRPGRLGQNCSASPAS